MNVKIGENIKRLRKERDMTQEQLAAELGVSFQAVSRWELGTTYPDIALLPVIAAYFDVTVDELLGVDMARREEEIREIQEQSKKLRHEGKAYEDMCFLREKVKEFPNSPILLYELSLSVFIYYFNDARPFDEEQKRKAVEEIAELCKKAIKYSDNEGFSIRCKRHMALAYGYIGEKERVREIVETFPIMAMSWDLNIARALPDDEAAIRHKKNVMELVDLLRAELLSIKVGYTEQQLIEIRQMTEEMILTVLGENPCYYNLRLCHICIGIARKQAELKQYDNVIDTLERAMQYAVNYEERPDKGKYSVFWMSGVEDVVENAAKSEEGTLYHLLANHMAALCRENSCYETNSRFKSIREKLQSHIASK